MQLKSLWPPRAAVAAVAAVLLVGCGGEDRAARPSAPPADAKRVDESKAGVIAGRVVIDGPVPENPAVQMDADPLCVRESAPGPSATEAFAVSDGGLENVFVYVKDGLDSYYFETPTEPVKLDQKGCRYVPHVVGARTGQPIEFSNSDPTLHNVHANAEVNRGFNFPQPLAGMRTTRTFTAREVMVHMKCDVHPWMSAYVGVMDHPYFAVTANGGRFELKNVPAGTYTLEAWHEKLGTQTRQVTLAEEDSQELTFTF